ncbi:Protein kinase domain-containing protein [Mycena chlorophos]|uniref:Protein kinase domain-containing protein n=1 Tax=Mycena chlorophos TaxID=658473 RepID=A0A8H6W8B4_MYCCL|nr:Protein kinase domain-containing protein [Mycena chlorophos]
MGYLPRRQISWITPEPTRLRGYSSTPSVADRAHSKFVDWLSKFDAQTKERVASSEGKVNEESESQFLDIEVYSRHIASLSQARDAQDPRLQADLNTLTQLTSSLDSVSKLVQSKDLRATLLHVSSILGISSDQYLRAALEKDDADLSRLLMRIACIESEKRKLLELKGETAQLAVDIIQDLLDKESLPNTSDVVSTASLLHLVARPLLVKLSESSGMLPASLFIHGVRRTDQDALFGGAFGDIYRAMYKGRQVALKRMRVFQPDSELEWQKLRRRFCREAMLWQRLQHPFVLSFTGIDAETFPTFLCIVSPWMKNGTLVKHLAENGKAGVELRLFEVAQGLAYLHSEGIVHGDLRGSNILVDDDWHARLADFGLSVLSSVPLTHTTYRSGSTRWMGPELLFPQSCGLDSYRRTFASDVYSFGSVCVELVQGQPPFCEIKEDMAVVLRVLEGYRSPRPCDPATGQPLISHALWAIVERCWTHDPAQRPSMARVVEMMQESRNARFGG